MSYKYNKVGGLFKDEKHNLEFEKDGYVVLPFLNPQELESIKSQFKELHKDIEIKGFYTTTFEKDEVHRGAVDKAIREVVARSIGELMKTVKVYCGSFIVKGADTKSGLIVHQDMTLVDESKYTGTNIWIPLVDLTEDYGPIMVLPGSHRLFPTYRGASLPDIYDDVVPEVKTYMKPLFLKAGTAVIFDQSIIHFSPPNKTESLRPVINTFVTHPQARVQICYRDKENNPDKVELFEQEEDFMINFQNFGHDIFSRPKIGKSLGFVDYDFPKLTVEMLDQKYGNPEGPTIPITDNKQESLIHRLWKKVWH